MVSARRGVAILSTTGLSAVLMNKTARSMAPVLRNSLAKYSASSNVIPMAAKTTAKSPAPSLVTLAWRAIWAAMRAWGKPAPEKIGNFWPRTRVFRQSMVEMPV